MPPHPHRTVRLTEPTPLREWWQETPFARALGLRVEELHDGYCRVRLSVRPEHRNTGVRVVHGGVLATLVDAAVGGATLSLQESDADYAGQTTVELTISYLSPALGDELVAEGRLSKRGRTLAFGDAEVRDGDGTLVAKGQAIYMVWRQPPSDEARG